MNFKDEEVLAGWEDILAKKYNLKLAETADGYPDKRSINVSYKDIDEYDSDLAMFIIDHPDKCLALGRKAIKNLMPPSWDQQGAVNLRLFELPSDARVEIRNLRSKHLGKLVAMTGLVRKVTQVRPKMTKALFKCTKCDAEQWVEQFGMLIREPTMCTSVDGSCSRTNAQFILVDGRSHYVDTQKIEIQESPEGLRGGAQPERLAGYLEDDIAGTSSPGNRVILNGIIRAVQKTERDRSSVFETFMEVHSMEFEQHEYDDIIITEEDEEKIIGMSEDEKLFDNLIGSVSPTIYGLETEKEAIALQLFGGTNKVMDDGTVIRGDIHILLIGDPGVAKSQLLRYMSTLAPRGIYASGKSASAAGLCVHGDTIITAASGDVTIKEFVESRMNAPEEYKEGIWRQPINGESILAVTENGFPKMLPVSYIWRIRTPPLLVELTAEGGERILITQETKVLAKKDILFDWAPSGEIKAGDMVLMTKPGNKVNMRSAEIRETRRIENDSEYVYDLTVEQAHSFFGNGFAVHNTAAAVKDDFGDGRWTLEAGALVLADKGLACIDELDKMSEQDTSSLHEAMESQKISVAKAGITATLQCRCSLLAAANPKRGRFEDGDIGTQINLPPTLMSRFDMIFTIKDKPEKNTDTRITEHILKVHRRGQVKKSGSADAQSSRIKDETDNVKPVYEPDIMRKYVAYSKRIIPVMSDEAFEKIRDNYLQIRNTGGGSSRSVPITARQLEAYIRLSEASARARLSNVITNEDAERSIRIIHYYLDKVLGGERDGKTVWDADKIMTGIPATVRDEMDIIKDAINEYVAREGKAMPKTELFTILAGQINETEISRTLDKLTDNGELYMPTTGGYKVT